jgi:hypothetical protein
MEHSDMLWQWNPQSEVIVDQKWLKDSLQSVESKRPPLWTMQIFQEHFSIRWMFSNSLNR